MRICLACLLVLCAANVAVAQFKDEAPAKGPTLGREVTQRLKVGIVVKAGGGTVFHIVATAPVPTDWPEQQVKIVNEDISSSVKSLTYRTITGGGGLKQMVVEIPQLPAGQDAKALVTFEVTRKALVPPAKIADYTIPKKLDRVLNINVGPSPYIEARHPKIVAAAKEAVADVEGDWQKVTAIAGWVREHVVYKHCDLKGAARALHDKTGDADELASLFIAMCRSQKIPARTVFVSNHVYAEFCLLDDDGQPQWFPYDPTSVNGAGTVDDLHPILQKGDNFKNPENPKERQRYVTEYFNASGRGGKPHVDFICELVAE